MNGLIWHSDYDDFKMAVPSQFKKRRRKKQQPECLKVV